MSSDLKEGFRNYLKLKTDAKVKAKTHRRTCLHSSFMISPKDSFLPSLKSPSPLPVTIEDQEYPSGDDQDDENEEATTQSELYST